VVELQPANALDGKDVPGTNNASPSNDRIDVVLGDGGSSVDNDFAEGPSVPLKTPGRISGQVAIDANDDGALTADETAIGGVLIELVDTLTGTVIASVRTNPDGTYMFRDVLPGSYIVREVQPVLYGDGKDAPGTSAAISANDAFAITLAPGTWSENNNFGERLGSITGSVLLDRDRDGTPDAPIGGVTIDLVNAAGQVVATVNTATNGTFTFPDLVAGVYKIRERQPEAWADGAEKYGADGSAGANDEIVVNLGGGVASIGHAFIEQTPLAPVVAKVVPGSPATPAVLVIQATVQPQELIYVPIVDVVEKVVQAAPPVIVTTTPVAEVAEAPTAPPVAPNPAPALIVVTPEAAPVSVPPIVAAAPKAVGTLSGRVWLDRNADASLGGKEQGVGGVKLRVFNSAGVLVDTIETDSEGRWSTTQPIGDYEIEPVLPEGFRPTTPTRVKAIVVEGVAIVADSVGFVSAPFIDNLALTGAGSLQELETAAAMLALGSLAVVAGRRRRFGALRARFSAWFN
jgi:large repetitive protein